MSYIILAGTLVTIPMLFSRPGALFKVTPQPTTPALARRDITVTSAESIYDSSLAPLPIPTVNHPICPPYSQQRQAALMHLLPEQTEEHKRRKVRVLMAVNTMSTKLNLRARVVRDTWAQRADIALFLNSKLNTSFPTICLEVPEQRNFLVAKIMHAFHFSWLNYKDDADWFVKADDDAFVIIENLRHHLTRYDPDQPLSFGEKCSTKHHHYCGGASYVLSREALRRLVHRQTGICPMLDKAGTLGDHSTGVLEDLHIPQCLAKLGVNVVNNATDDSGGRLFHSQPFVFYKNRNDAGTNNYIISEYPVSFHYITPDVMLTMDRCIYKPVRDSSPQPPKNIPITPGWTRLNVSVRCHYHDTNNSNIDTSVPRP